MSEAYAFDWQDLAFGSKKPINAFSATFIAAPREMSAKRFAQLIKTYLPSGNIVLGLAKEPYVLGFEDQMQFKTLQCEAVSSIIEKVAASNAVHKIYTLAYLQRELPYLLEKLDFKRVVLVNGSWQHVFHASTAYYTLVNRQIPYDMVSPFTDENEAKTYAKTHNPAPTIAPDVYTAEDMLTLAGEVAKQSYDYSHQTGAVLGKPEAKGYKFLLSSFNKVVPYQTYAMHHGASREQHFSPPNDLNHYDTVHAEVELLLESQRKGLLLAGTTLFINLLPCPACARMFADSDLEEVVYQIDHSDGYAVKMLEAAGKKVRRIV